MIETASWVRRILALFVDWVASTLVVLLFIGPGDYYSETGDPWPGVLTLGVFVAESALLTATAGGSFGKLLTGLRVVRADGSGRPVDLLRAVLRAVLVALVVPPLVFKPDGRGLHDLAAGSATVPVGAARGAQPDTRSGS